MTTPLRVLFGLALLLLAGGAIVAPIAWHRSRQSGPLDARASASEPSPVPTTDPRVAPAFDTLRHGGSLAAALDLLEGAAAKDSLVLRDGHQLAHALGRLAVAEGRGDGSVVSQCRPDFASGCYHGVVEAFVQARGRVDMTELEHLCAGAGNREGPGLLHECVHGLGHGVLGAVGDVEAALHHCDALEPDLDAWCRDGVFMEGMSSVLGVTRSDAVRAPTSRHAHVEQGGHEHGSGLARQLPVDPADAYSPCDRFDGPYGSACWPFQGFLILRRGDFDAALALRTCDRAPADWVRDCYRSIGLQVTGLFQRDAAWIIQQCGRGRPSLAPECAAGAARALVQMDWSGAQVARLCAASPISWKDTCYRTAGAFLAVLAAPDQWKALCGGAERGYVDTCMRGAGPGGRVD